MSWRPEIQYKIRKIYIYHGENLPILVCRLVADEGGIYDVFNSTLSGGLCGIVNASGCGSGRGWRDRRSAIDVGGMDTTSAGILFANFSTSSVSPTSDMICSCVAVSPPSVSTFDDGSPSRGLSKEIGDDATPISIAVSEGNEGKA